MKKKNKFYRPALVYLLLAARALFNLLPFKWGHAFGGTMGKITFALLKKERDKTLAHLRLAFGREKTEKEIFEIGRAVFENYGKTLAELALLDKLIPRFDDYVIRTGYEHLDKGLRDGKGIIITTAHFGNWEIMGGYSALRGYPLTVIARKIYYEKYNELLVGMRKKMNVKIVYRDESIKAMLGVLRHNGILGFLVDQDIEVVDGVFVDFFGRPAFTPTAPVRFALSTGAPIIPAFALREGLKTHVVVCPPIDLVRTGNKEEELLINTQKWVKIQEDMIRKYPHLWVWNHKRWKTQAPKKEVSLHS